MPDDTNEFRRGIRSHGGNGKHRGHWSGLVPPVTDDHVARATKWLDRNFFYAEDSSRALSAPDRTVSRQKFVSPRNDREFQLTAAWLGGWSASGVVAYETARQLMEKGHEVALLVMFDTANPAFQQTVPKEVWLDSRAKKIGFHVRELAELKLKNAPAYVAEKAKELYRKIMRVIWQIHYRVQLHTNGGRLDNPEQIVQLAVNAYRPNPYAGRLVFFKAADGPPGDAWNTSRGWSHMASGELDVHEVPGDHRSMFLEPNVQTLANTMMNYLCCKESGQAAVT